MRISRTSWTPILCLLIIPVVLFIFAGTANSKRSLAQENQAAGASTNASPTENDNIQAYSTLLHENLPDEKGAVLGSMLLLSEADAAKFWPIYDQYQSELDKLNASAAASIDNYVKNNGQLSAQQADEIVQQGTQFQSQRAELLDKYYAKVKDAVGPETAARFFEVESQLASLTDLQRASRLPVVE